MTEIAGPSAARTPQSATFQRRATGLVREAGTLDVLIYNVDYVYVSRVLHPGLGVMSSFNNTVWWGIYGGVPSAFFALFGLGPFFQTVGQMGGVGWMTDVGDWILTKPGTFVCGTALIVVLVALFIRGFRL